MPQRRLSWPVRIGWTIVTLGGIALCFYYLIN